MITHELVKIKMDGAAHHSSYKSLVKRVLILLSRKDIRNDIKFFQKLLSKIRAR